MQQLSVPRPQHLDTFCPSDLRSFDVLAESSEFCLGRCLLSRLVSELLKPCWTGLEPGAVFGSVAFISVVPRQNKQLSIRCPSCIVVGFRTTRSLRRKSNSGHFFRVLGSVSVTSCWQQQLWSSVMFSLLAAANRRYWNSNSRQFSGVSNRLCCLPGPKE
jgi:hypothetical protein